MAKKTFRFEFDDDRGLEAFTDGIGATELVHIIGAAISLARQWSCSECDCDGHERLRAIVQLTAGVPDMVQDAGTRH